MRPYAFLKFDGSSKPPVVDLGEFGNELEARSNAHRLLREGLQYAAIEVRDGDNMFTVARPERLGE